MTLEMERKRKKERKKESKKERHPRQWKNEMSCLRWDFNPWHSALRNNNYDKNMEPYVLWVGPIVKTKGWTNYCSFYTFHVFFWWNNVTPQIKCLSLLRTFWEQKSSKCSAQTQKFTRNYNSFEISYSFCYWTTTSSIPEVHNGKCKRSSPSCGLDYTYIFSSDYKSLVQIFILNINEHE